MQTYLMRNGIEERDYTEEIPQWTRLVQAVLTDARAEEQAAIASLLAATPEPTSVSAPTMKKEVLDPNTPATSTKVNIASAITAPFGAI